MKLLSSILHACTEKLECRNVATEDKNPLEIGVSSCERNKLVFWFGVNDLNRSNSIYGEKDTDISLSLKIKLCKLTFGSIVDDIDRLGSCVRPLFRWWLLNQIHCVSISISVVSNSGKKSSIFLHRGTDLCSCKAIFSFEWPKRRRYNTVQAKSGKDAASDWTKTICLTTTNSWQTVSNSCYKQPRYQVLEVASKKILSTNLWETFFFSLNPSSHNLLSTSLFSGKRCIETE